MFYFFPNCYCHTVDDKICYMPSLSTTCMYVLTYRIFLLYNVVYDRNLVSVSATETKIKFWYRYRSLNFFCLNRNFLHCIFSNYSHTFCALFWIFARSYRVIILLLCKLSGILIKNAKLVTKTHIWLKKIVSGKAFVMKHRKEVNK